MPHELAKEVALRFHEQEATSQLRKIYPKSIKIKCGPQCGCKTTPFIM
jgi:hypothetical protein